MVLFVPVCNSHLHPFNVQGGIAEAWKDNLLDELAKGELEVDTVKKLFTKIKNDFGETLEEERKIEQL